MALPKGDLTVPTILIVMYLYTYYVYYYFTVASFCCTLLWYIHIAVNFFKAYTAVQLQFYLFKTIFCKVNCIGVRPVLLVFFILPS